MAPTGIPGVPPRWQCKLRHGAAGNSGFFEFFPEELNTVRSLDGSSIGYELVLENDCTLFTTQSGQVAPTATCFASRRRATIPHDWEGATLLYCMTSVGSCFRRRNCQDDCRLENENFGMNYCQPIWLEEDRTISSFGYYSRPTGRGDRSLAYWVLSLRLHQNEASLLDYSLEMLVLRQSPPAISSSRLYCKEQLQWHFVRMRPAL